MVSVNKLDFLTDGVPLATRPKRDMVKLIGGRELARLMIRHGVGVRDRVSYVIRSVDEDYFSDPEG